MFYEWTSSDCFFKPNTPPSAESLGGFNFNSIYSAATGIVLLKFLDSPSIYFQQLQTGLSKEGTGYKKRKTEKE